MFIYAFHFSTFRILIELSIRRLFICIFCLHLLDPYIENKTKWNICIIELLYALSYTSIYVGRFWILVFHIHVFAAYLSGYCNTKYGNSIAYLQLFFLLFLFKFLSTSILVKDVTDDPKICPLKKPLVETSRMSSMTAWYFLNKSSNEYMLTKFSLHLSKGRSESWNVQMFQCDVLADELWLFKIFHMLLPQPFTSLPC